jgi:MerR family mercuric resistance operon transcriptional regulator
MQASELAKSHEVSKDTLRYYERTGLITKPKRTSNGYRIYGAEHERQLKFIKFAQSAGFPLSKIKEAIPFLDSPQPNCPRLKAAIDEQLHAIEAKMEELKTAKSTLLKWMKHNHASTI